MDTPLQQRPGSCDTSLREVVTPRRRILQQAVSLLIEKKFNSVEKAALETLTEMLQGLLTELPLQTRSFSELAGRVEPTVGDVTMALVNMGIRLDPEALKAFVSNRRSRVLQGPGTLPIPKVPSVLSVYQSSYLGRKRTHHQHQQQQLPHYIPDYFPPMPDPHAYIRTPVSDSFSPTPTSKKLAWGRKTHPPPLTDYSLCRTQTSTNKRDLERSLTKYIARTGSCFNLFPASVENYSLILPKTLGSGYLEGLLPRDQIFFEDCEEDDEKLNFVRKEEEDVERLNDDGMKKRKKVYVYEKIDNPFLKDVRR